jgi:hypothetical protein
MSRVASVLLLGLLLLVSAAPALNVRAELFTGSHVVVVDSFVFGTNTTYRPADWSGDTMVYDTFDFQAMGVWPRTMRLYATVDLQPVPLRPEVFVQDSWYEFGLRPTDARVRFSELGAGVEEATGQVLGSSFRVTQNPCVGPVRLNASLPAGTTPGVEVYNGAGVLVRSFDGLVWDRRDVSGKSVAAGLYLLKVSSGNASGLIKVILTD